jgi:hypothetical protein
MRYGIVAFALALVFTLAACGGDSDSESDDDNDGGSGDDPTATAASGGGGSAATPSGDDSDDDDDGAGSGGSGEAGTATATIGDQTYEFTFTGVPPEQCDTSVSGVIAVAVMFGVDEDGDQIALSISGPATGGDGTVQVGDPILIKPRWTADPEVYNRLANVQGMPEGVGATFQVDGNRISGSGTFYDDTALTNARQVTGEAYDAGVRQGTFEATCPG